MKRKYIFNGLTMPLVSVLCSCASLQAITYHADPRSGIDNIGSQTTIIYPIYQKVDEHKKVTFSKEEFPVTKPDIIKFGSVFANEMDDCGIDRGKEFAGLIPLLIPLVGIAVEQGLQGGASYFGSLAKKIEDASVVKYSAQTIVQPPATLGDISCLLIVRKTKKIDEKDVAIIGLIALFAIKPNKDGKSFVLAPKFLQMNNSVAKTSNKKPVSVSLEFIGKVAQKNKDGGNAINTFMSPLPILADNIALESSIVDIANSEMLATPASDLSAIQITVNIKESGSSAPNSTKVSSEADAIAKAIGPKISSALQTALAAGK